jgi:hypothetical protein
LVLLEHLQNAEMREATRETSAKGKSYAWPKGQRCWTFVQGLSLRIVVLLHERRMTGTASSTNGPRVLKKQYECTAMETGRNSMRKSQTVPSY